MFKAIDNPYLVPFDGSFKIKGSVTKPAKSLLDKKKIRKELNQYVDQLDQLQRMLYAHDSRSVLLVFQGMDAAGKNSTIRAVMRGIDPSGCQVYSFKQPNNEELDHDFLWRTAIRVPERGRIGIFNRSYYEEVLIVKVHPEILERQKLPADMDWQNIWQQRYKSINDFEEHLAGNGAIILKFWLNISRQEQRRRFLSRLNEPEKNWKFSEQDVREREHWKSYMDAYETALNNCSRPWAPWYAIPADDKGYMHLVIAEIIVKSLASLNLHYPEITASEKNRFNVMRNYLQQEKD